jgi:hypothetical protein
MGRGGEGLGDATGQATRDVSGDATAAGLEPDRVFYAGSAAIGPEPTGPTGPSPGGHSGMLTPTR